MRFTNIEYTNFLYDKKYEFQISQKPIVLLLAQDYLNNSEIKNLFYFIKKCQVKWIITTGYIAIKYEEYIDNFLEDCSISDVNYLDIVTTSFTYIKLNNQIAEEIVNEFINISCIGLVEYQLVSFLNLNNHEERIIYNLINKFLYKSKDLDIVSS